MGARGQGADDVLLVGDQTAGNDRDAGHLADAADHLGHDARHDLQKVGVAGVDLDEEGAPKTSLWYLYGEAVDFCARADCGDEKGASYSTARVSGLIAAALQIGMEKTQIPEYLAAMAQDMGAPGFDDRYGWGYLEIP